MTKSPAKARSRPPTTRSDKADDRRYPSRPFVAVGIVIWRDDKILLVRRGKPPRQGDWGLPGGMQDTGETVIEAALREAREETGLEVTPLGVITVIDGITRDAKGKSEFHYTIIEVAAESRDGEAEAGSDVLDVRWATLEETEKLCGWAEVARVARLSALQRIL